MTNSGDSGTLTFDDIIDANPLLFRLHSDTSSNTYFDAKNKVLLSSRRAKERNKGQDISFILKSLDENPSLSTPYEPSAVARHITCWLDGNTEPSDFISLSSNICFVWWDWKRRRSHQSWRPDDFFVVVLKSSELRGLAKLGTEIVNKWQHTKAYNFTQAFDEVIVADVIRPSAILGTIPMSQLGDFVPSWWEKPLASITPGSISQSEEKGLTFKDFLLKSKAPANKSEDECTRESIRFALALIAPMMVRGGQQHAESHNGSVVDPAATYRGGDVAADTKPGSSSEMGDMVVEMDVD